MTNEEKTESARALSDDDLRGFNYDQEQIDAKMIADLYRLGCIKESLDEFVFSLKRTEEKDWPHDWTRMARLVVGELDGKPRRKPISRDSFNIIRAYIAAAAADGRDSREAVTIYEVRSQFAEMFAKKQRPPEITLRVWLETSSEIPPRQTFRRVLKRYGANIRRERE
jgi:hypothetical protein